jgi:hypothetical protein
MKIQVRHEIYDDSGLIETLFVEEDIKTDEELISEKEAELLKVYEEIQQLKNLN